MTLLQRRTNFLQTEEGQAFEHALRDMVADMAFLTPSSFSANTTEHPDNMMSFIDKHIEYIVSHQHVNPEHYLSNLRLMTRKR